MEYHIVVSGRVQGVGFRYYTVRVADCYGITGWVRNNYDGTVEILAQGPENMMKDFILKIKNGPITSEVTSINIDKRSIVRKYTSFEIKF